MTSTSSQVLKLVERFECNLDAYKSADYKEARVRVEFIDPFFEALGWDVRNTQRYALDPKYKYNSQVGLVQHGLQCLWRLRATSILIVMTLNNRGDTEEPHVK